MARFSRIGTRTGTDSTPVIFTSEHELQSELQLPRVSGCQDLARGRRSKTRIGRPEIDMVQSVEHLPAELQILFLGELKILGQVAVQSRDSGSGHDSHSGIAELISRRIREGVRIEPQIRAGSRRMGVADNVGAGVHAIPKGRARHTERERRSGGKGVDSGNLPSAQQEVGGPRNPCAELSAASEGKFINTADI